MFAKYSPALLHMVQNNSFSGRASCLRRVHIKNSPGAHDYLNPPLFVCVTKLLFDQVFISLFSGSAAMFYLNSCLQDFAFNMFFFFLHVYNVWLPFDYYCMFNQFTFVFAATFYLY